MLPNVCTVAHFFLENTGLKLWELDHFNWQEICLNNWVEQLECIKISQIIWLFEWLTLRKREQKVECGKMVDAWYGCYFHQQRLSMETKNVSMLETFSCKILRLQKYFLHCCRFWLSASQCNNVVKLGDLRLEGLLFAVFFYF